MSTTTRLGTGVVAPDTTGAVETPSATTAPVPGRAADVRRRLLAGVAFAGPVALGVQYVLSDGMLAREEAGPYLAAIAENSTSHVLAVAVYLVAMLGGVAAAVLLAIAGRRSAPWLSAVAASMLVTGVVGGSGFAGLRLAAVDLARSGDPAAADLYAATQSGATFGVLQWFLIMAILGTLVAAATIVRARRDIAVWAAPVMVVGFVLTSGEFPVWVSAAGQLVALAALVPVARAALRA